MIFNGKEINLKIKIRLKPTMKFFEFLLEYVKLMISPAKNIQI